MKQICDTLKVPAGYHSKKEFTATDFMPVKALGQGIPKITSPWHSASDEIVIILKIYKTFKK